MNDFDFANLDNAQRHNLIREIELAKHAWLDVCFKRLSELGHIPAWIYQSAHSINQANGEAAIAASKAAGWLKAHGFRVIDNWSAAGLGAVLMQGDRIIHQLRIRLDPACELESHGNKPNPSVEGEVEVEDASGDNP